MADCDHINCDGDDSLSRTCSYCSLQFCNAHRLPEKHNCIALNDVNTLGPEFRAEKQTPTVTQQGMIQRVLVEYRYALTAAFLILSIGLVLVLV